MTMYRKFLLMGCVKVVLAIIGNCYAWSVETSMSEGGCLLQYIYIYIYIHTCIAHTSICQLCWSVVYLSMCPVEVAFLDSCGGVITSSKSAIILSFVSYKH